MRTETITATIEGDEGVPFGVDEDRITHLLSVLTNMYADPHRAVAREYMANAWDSHVAAGCTDRPIEVETNCGSFGDEPQFIVRDYGVGMSLADILDRYIRYGSSDKGGTNDQIGGFGIGCKVAFAIAEAFSVEAVKDGEHTVAVFTRGADDRPTHSTLLHEYGTDLPNGVTVTITLTRDDLRLVECAVYRLAETWHEGGLRFNGTIMHRPEYDTEHLPEGWCWSDSYGHRLSVIMGGIEYPVESSTVATLADKLPDGLVQYALESRSAPGLVCTLPVGAVDLPPSRESVRATPRTIKVLTEALATLQRDMQADYVTRAERADSLFEAAKVAEGWQAVHCKVSRYAYGGLTLETDRWGEVAVTAKMPHAAPGVAWGGPESVLTVSVKRWEIRPSDAETFLVVQSAYTPALRRYARALILEPSTTVKNVVFADEVTYEDGWLRWGVEGEADAVRVVSVDELKAEAKPFLRKQGKGGGGGEPKFSVSKVNADGEFVNQGPMTVAEAIEMADGQDILHAPTRDVRHLDLAEGTVIIWHPGNKRSRQALLRRAEASGISDGEALLREHVRELMSTVNMADAALGHVFRLGTAAYHFSDLDRTLVTNQEFLDYLDRSLNPEPYIDCWQSIAWTHRYGFSIPEDEIEKATAKANLPEKFAPLYAMVQATYAWTEDDWAFLAKIINNIDVLN